MKPQSIAAVNRLPDGEKRTIYSRFIPRVLLGRYRIPADFTDDKGRPLLDLRCAEGSTDVEVTLRHTAAALDPLLYTHLTDTINGRIHVLLYVINDPESPRFDVDRLPDGTSTKFGSLHRNRDAERAAMDAGLAPGQVRTGLHTLRQSVQAFEEFAQSLGHDLYFVDPLYYHNAITFERYGFAYQSGRRLMEEIDRGFSPEGDLAARLDGSTPFRQPSHRSSVRGRSWAIHDGILGEPFSGVTMYKRIGVNAGLDTFPAGKW